MQGQPDPGAGLRLHLNENTGGCSPRVVEAVGALTAGDLSTYPGYARLVHACADHFDVDPTWVLVSNGLDEGILMTAVAHVARAQRHDAEVLVPLPAFDPYVNAARAVGAAVVCVAPADDLAFPAEAVLRAITPRTRLVYLNTPNNPSGQVIAHDDLLRVARAAPDAVVFIDEAYIEFGGTSFLPELHRHPNVLVGRTFSKAYGLAGVRVGVVIGQAAALDPIRAVTLPFNLNAVAQVAVLAAIEDDQFVPRYVAQVRESRDLVSATCRRLGLRCWEHAGNFVLVQVGGSAGKVARAMAAAGIHVRDRSHDPSTPGCLRITAGLVVDTVAAVSALERAVAACADTSADPAAGVPR